MKMVIKKITKIKRTKKIIYITEFGANADYNYPTDWGELNNGGPKGTDAGPHLKAPY